MKDYQCLLRLIAEELNVKKVIICVCDTEKGELKIISDEKGLSMTLGDTKLENEKVILAACDLLFK